MSLKLREATLNSLKPKAQARAKAIAQLADKIPELESAIRSRNNEDMRKAIVAVARGAKNEETAAVLLGIISAENLSAFLQFCDGLFEGVDSAKPRASAVDISGLLNDL